MYCNKMHVIFAQSFYHANNVLFPHNVHVCCICQSFMFACRYLSTLHYFWRCMIVINIGLANSWRYAHSFIIACNVPICFKVCCINQSRRFASWQVFYGYGCLVVAMGLSFSTCISNQSRVHGFLLSPFLLLSMFLVHMLVN